MPRKSTVRAMRRPTCHGTRLNLPKTAPFSLTPTVRALSRRRTPGYRRHDSDLVRVRDRCVQALTEAYILVVQKKVDELPRLPVVVQKPPLEARKPRIQLLDGRTKITGVNGHCGLAAAQAAQRTRNSENRHLRNSLRNLTRAPFRGTTSGSALFRLGARHRRRPPPRPS